MQKLTCFITHKPITAREAVYGGNMRDTLFTYIKGLYPAFTEESYISRVEFLKLRREYLMSLVKTDSEEATDAEKEVVNAISSNKIMTEDIEPIIDKQLTFGQRAADRIAEFGGSWAFIISFFTVLMVWIAINVWFLGKKAFDPYPFILLNLILSCLAAIQAPIIMMSQNRVEEKDRLRSENDYKINLKAELEIKLLHEKLEHIDSHMHKVLAELQQMQIEYLDEMQNDLRCYNEQKRMSNN
ncbi:MAG: DUF1003 domain-containing protein [Tannerellaceae bacterium]